MPTHTVTHRHTAKLIHKRFIIHKNPKIYIYYTSFACVLGKAISKMLCSCLDFVVKLYIELWVWLSLDWAHCVSTVSLNAHEITQVFLHLFSHHCEWEEKMWRNEGRLACLYLKAVLGVRGWEWARQTGHTSLLSHLSYRYSRGHWVVGTDEGEAKTLEVKQRKKNIR